MRYEFTLRIRLLSPSVDHARLLRALATAGCDDALVGLGRLPRVALSFDRESHCASAAVATALAQVRSALPNVRVAEISRVRARSGARDDCKD